MRTAFFLGLAVIAAAASAWGQGGSGLLVPSVSEAPAEPVPAPAPIAPVGNAPDGAADEDAPAPLPPLPPKRTVNTPFSLDEGNNYFEHWEQYLCTQDPAATDNAEKLARRREGNQELRPGNKLGSLLLLLENDVSEVKKSSTGRVPASVTNVRRALGSNFLPLRDLTKLNGRPGSEKDAERIIAAIRRTSPCQIRAVQRIRARAPQK